MSVSYHSGMAASGTSAATAASAAGSSQYRIPDELQEILLDFTVNYLIEQPSDIARFGVEYFVKLTAARNNKNEVDHSDDESMLSDEEIRRNGLNIQGIVNFWLMLSWTETKKILQVQHDENRCLRKHTIQKKTIQRIPRLFIPNPTYKDAL